MDQWEPGWKFGDRVNAVELKLVNGDYVTDNTGGQVRLEGQQALLQRILFRLTARRGMFPPLPGLGSRLWTLGQERGSGRFSAARQYVAEALAEEDVAVTAVRLAEAGGGRLQLEVELLYQGENLTAAATL